MELQKLYADNEVNPLAGCLPAFAQIPVFIGLYRAVLNLAKEVSRRPRGCPSSNQGLRTSADLARLAP